MTTLKQRLRFGAFDVSDGPSGLSRYLISILNQLDREQFELVLFEHAHGPYRNIGPARHVIVCGEEACGASAPVPTVAGGHELKILRSAWRHFAPAYLKHRGGFLRDSRKWCALFRCNPVDLLYLPITSCEPAAAAARLAGVPCVTGTFHTEAPRVRWHERLMERRTAHSLHTAIAVSEATRQDWLKQTGLPQDRVVTIHNGIDPEICRAKLSREDARRQLGLPADRLIIAGVGRLATMKGFSETLDALAILKSEFPCAMVVIAGDGPLREQLESQIRTLGLADHAALLGFCTDVGAVYDAADVFVLSSIMGEAAPYVVLEAMSHELPVVGTRVGGVPEMLDSGETGFLIPPGDTAALAAALRPLLSSAELRQRMGKAGRQRVIRCFHEDDMVRKTLEVYQQMLRNAHLMAPATG
ncbi:MAG: glycosyltransferase family 4 protein, partial [Thermoguttaceae bacterium]